MVYLVLVGVGRARTARPAGFVCIGRHHLATLFADWLVLANRARKRVAVLKSVGAAILTLKFVPSRVLLFVQLLTFRAA